MRPKGRRVQSEVESWLESYPLLDFGYQKVRDKLYGTDEGRSLPSALMQKVLKTDLAACEVPVGAAAELLNDDRVRGSLANVPHLGSLASMVAISASRLDYVRLWIDILAKIKIAHPGLGLSARYNSDRENGLTRLEILQSWVILANCGHMFGTFSTERALLYTISQGGDERSEFNRSLAQMKNDFGEQCASIVDKGDYLSFFYTLAAWRLNYGDLKKIAHHKRVVGTWRLFFDTYHSDEDNARLMHWLFRKSRQIVTAYIHSVMGIGSSLMVQRKELAKGILHGGAIAGYSSGVPETDMSTHLSELESLHLRVFFASEGANLCTLQDMRLFRIWWESHSSESVHSRISQLFREPSDWGQSRLGSLSHFCRLYIPSEAPREKWLREVQRWKGGTDWGGDEFHMSLAGSSGLNCDLYVDLQQPNIGSLCQSARNMASKFTSLPSPRDRQRMATTTAVFGVRLLSFLHSANGLVSVRPVASEDKDQVGLAILADDLLSCQHSAGEFMRSCLDPVRRRELQCFYDRKDVGLDEPGGSAVLLFLGKLVLFDRLTYNEVTDIDLAWAEFFEDKVIWTFCQCKDGRQTGGRAQLESVRRYFPTLGAVRRLPDTGTTKCWAAQVTWGA